MEKKGVKICSIASMVLGLIMLAGGVVLLCIIPCIIRQILMKEMFFGASGVNDTQLNLASNLYINPNYTIGMQYWFFNVTNARDVELYGDKPNLTQVGPYGYRERQRKKDCTFNQTDESLSYRNFRWYYFDPSISCTTCAPDDLVTVANPVLAAVSHILAFGKWSWWKRGAINGALDLAEEYMFTTQKADELIYSGYSDGLINLTDNAIIKELLKLMGITTLFPPGFDKMAFFYKQNATYDGDWKVRTGEGDPDEIGEVMTWNNSPLLPSSWWSGTDVRNLSGSTDGSIFKPYLTSDAKLKVFASKVCRHIELDYQEKGKYKKMNTVRFISRADNLDTNLEKNWGYKHPMGKWHFYPNTTNDSLPAGLLNVSMCQPGTPPIVLSLPHFTNCPDEVVDSVFGMEPRNDEQVYDMADMHIEPTLGLAVTVASRAQVNVAFYPVSGITRLEKIPDYGLIVPALWQNESAVIDEHSYKELYRKLYGSKHGAYAGAVVLTALGVVAIILSIILGWRAWRRSEDDDTEPLVNSED